ncbi:MAG: 50S ribosomal protein L19 [Bacteroidia bacterium]|nr:50S ribosomal protein L19 [Bacteroidia bacterium]MCX7652366.1 50S ribosomal protein L19 [Bacteroidia bacterium]MDW8417660.1 50S ribosomal protein L19 [Bacteroidia bacterium]
MSNLIREVEYLINAPYVKSDLPDFRSGDIVRLHLKIVEGGKERTQVFEGMVIQRRGSGIRETITVRKVSGGVGVERIVPLHSPFLMKLEVLRRNRTRRARLFYMRGRLGKALRLKRREA